MIYSSRLEKNLYKVSKSQLIRTYYFSKVLMKKIILVFFSKTKMSDYKNFTYCKIVFSELICSCTEGYNYCAMFEVPCLYKLCKRPSSYVARYIMYLYILKPPAAYAFAVTYFLFILFTLAYKHIMAWRVSTCATITSSRTWHKQYANSQSRAI